MVDLKWNRKFALDMAGDDEDFLAELLVLFREETAKDLARIKKAVDENDLVSSGVAAHNIKGAASSLGITAIHEIVIEIEKAGKAGALDEVAKHLPELENLTNQLETLK